MNDTSSDVDLNEYSDFDSDAVGSDTSPDSVDDSGSLHSHDSITGSNRMGGEVAKNEDQPHTHNKARDKPHGKAAVENQKQRLHLLKLPTDLLKLILGEVCCQNFCNVSQRCLHRDYFLSHTLCPSRANV